MMNLDLCIASYLTNPIDTGAARHFPGIVSLSRVLMKARALPRRWTSAPDLVSA
jgi:hypothetical protein